MGMASAIAFVRVKWRKNDHLFGPEVKKGCQIQVAGYLSRFISGATILHC